ncbi:MAG: 50S ribosomal protein L23 [candidate division WOR-3 bacterium]|nr:MAG: 50S ribosomal protein L23 [candidate division WOR-3 bacterium]
MRSEKIIRRALITEKADRLREMNCYQFEVAKKANKREIKEAVEKLFNVNVTDVKTANFRGKPKRMGISFGYKTGYKKATVTLKPGQKIELIEGI